MELMVAPSWPGTFHRTIHDTLVVFQKGQVINVGDKGLPFVKTDIGKSLVIVKRDGNGRPRPDYENTERFVNGEDVVNDPIEQDKEEEENFLSSAIIDLDIPTPAKQALAAAGLNTIEEMLDYADENGGLTKIVGIGKTTEDLILKLIDGE